jgi:hypothetical protein
MLEVIAEGTEGIPEDRGEGKTVLSPLQLLSLKMSSTNRGGGGDCGSGVGSVPAPDWRKRRIGHIHLEDGWRPEIVGAGLEPVPAGEDRGCSLSPASLKRHEAEDFEDPELARSSSLGEEEEEERWEEVGGEQRKSGEENWLVDRGRHGGESGGAQRGSSKTSSALLSVDFGTRRAKSPVTVQESRQKAVGDRIAKSSVKIGFLARKFLKFQ